MRARPPHHNIPLQSEDVSELPFCSPPFFVSWHFVTFHAFTLFVTIGASIPTYRFVPHSGHLTMAQGVLIDHPKFLRGIYGTPTATSSA